MLAPPVEHAANDELSSAIRDFVHENWASVRTHVVNGPVQTRYNRRLTSLDMRVLNEPLGELFDEQTTAFNSLAARGGNLAKIPPNRVIADFGRGSSVESESE